VSSEDEKADTRLTSWPDAYRSSVVIHHATLYPVVKTACGKLGPSTTEERYVDCEACRTALGIARTRTD
jgi:hypothetical protein